MGVIKGVLKEELNNSKSMLKSFLKALKQLPRGSIIKKRRRARYYYYLQYREKGKVKQVYKGKIGEKELKKYEETKILRKKYRHSISVLKKQIRYLKGVLRGKESI